MVLREQALKLMLAVFKLLIEKRLPLLNQHFEAQVNHGIAALISLRTASTFSSSLESSLRPRDRRYQSFAH